MLVVDESSLASSEQMRNLFRIATALRLPRVVLVGDEKQLGAVEAGKPFAQLRAAGMQTAVMDDIVRQRDAELKAAVRASLTGDVKGAFARLGDNIRQVEYGDLGAGKAGREAGAARSHPRTDGPRVQLHHRRYGDLHPPLQDARGGQTSATGSEIVAGRARHGRWSFRNRTASARHGLAGPRRRRDGPGDA